MRQIGKPIKALFMEALLLLMMISLSGCKPLINAFAFHPDNTNVLQASQLPKGVEELRVLTEDNVMLTTLYLRSPNADKLVIFFHGNAGNIYGRLADLQMIHGSGVSVIGVSYRGYGRSEGRPSEEGVYLDGKAVFQYAVDTLGYKKKDIIILGRSIGTTVAINTAQYQYIGGLILVTPLTTGKAQAKRGILRLVSPLAGRSFDNLSKVDHIRTRLLVVHGTADETIPFEMGKTIYRAAPVKKEFVKIDGAGHNNLTDFGLAYWGPILDFIHR